VLRSHGITVPKSGLVSTPAEAREIVLSKNLFPCVLKPIRGAHGNRVFVNIESARELNEILPQIFTRSGKKNVLLEEYVKGKDYRLLVIGNKVSAATERIPAHVVGDGKSNLRQLAKKFNQNPLVGKKYEKPLCRIRLDKETKRILKKVGKKLSYIPKEGETVFLRQNANISTGGISKDATNEVDNELKKMAIRAAKALGMVITGVDIIYDQPSKQMHVLELNDCPGIDIHHFPTIGKSRQVADDIIDYLLREKMLTCA